MVVQILAYAQYGGLEQVLGRHEALLGPGHHEAAEPEAAEAQPEPEEGLQRTNQRCARWSRDQPPPTTAHLQRDGLLQPRRGQRGRAVGRPRLAPHQRRLNTN